MILENVLLSALLIFLARVVSIAISTIRTLMMTRGTRLLSAGMGFVEALLFALTISQVVQNLDNVWNLVGYSTGFACGILLGMAIEERLAMGYATINIISTVDASRIAEAIREAGFGATESLGRGSEGEVGIVRTVVPRRSVETVGGIANLVDPASFVTVEPTLAVRRGHLGLMDFRS